MEKSCGVPLQLSGRFGTVTSWCHLTITVNASGVAKNRLIRFDNSTGKQLQSNLFQEEKIFPFFASWLSL